jgi:putative tricarboxylic transport membrane protein
VPAEKRADRIFGLVSALLALLFVTIAVPGISGDWGQDADYYTVGPRFFPYVAGSLLLVFAILIAVVPDGGSRIATLRAPGVARNVAAAMAIAIAYVALLDILGFTIATVLALIAFCLSFGERRWYVVLPLALIVAVATQQAFLELFMLELPAGRLDWPI